jgi:hypothetical protein
MGIFKEFIIDIYDSDLCLMRRDFSRLVYIPRPLGSSNGHFQGKYNWHIIQLGKSPLQLGVDYCKSATSIRSGHKGASFCPPIITCHVSLIHQNTSKHYKLKTPDHTKFMKKKTEVPAPQPVKLAVNRAAYSPSPAVRSSSHRDPA